MDNIIVENESQIELALSRLPKDPGIYRMYDDANQLIYVGKAKNLKNRVRSYFQKNQSQQSPKVIAMVQQVHHFDTIVTDTEVEALILEANLIKQYHPKYNILLRDDKKYPWLALSREPFPRLYMVRNVEASGLEKDNRTKYFGPYTNSADLYNTLKIIRKHFPLRQRRKPLFKNRPCMNYYIGHCLGPCQALVTPEDYAKIVRQVELFLKGKTDELLLLIQQEMREASDAMNFEWAAKLRDRYQAVQSILSHQQKVVSEDITLNQDVIAAAADDLRCVLVVLNIRHGKLLGSKTHEVKLPYQATLEEAYASFLSQCYESMPPAEIPDELLLQFHAEDKDVLAAWLSGERAKARLSPVRVLHPEKGRKKELLEMGVKNAREALAQAKLYDINRHKLDPARALMELQETLNLPDFPARMECYDISHFQGSQTVASMVVFTDGVPDSKEYRRFKIKTAEGKPDDFKSMAEVIRRRFLHSSERNPVKTLLERGESSEHDSDGRSSIWPDADLIIIDGGKGQLHAAMAVLQAEGIENQPIISLAKKFEEVYLPDQSRPVILSRNSPALFLLQQIRDEAHRFAITYHRHLRGKAAVVSELDKVAGVGEKRKDKLLSHFGSMEEIKKASVSELALAAGVSSKVAEKIYEALHG